jgi:hypothetical protein
MWKITKKTDKAFFSMGSRKGCTSGSIKVGAKNSMKTRMMK